MMLMTIKLTRPASNTITAASVPHGPKAFNPKEREPNVPKNAEDAVVAVKYATVRAIAPAPATPPVAIRPTS